MKESAERPLRVLGVDPELRFAGGESQVLGLSVELSRMGHRAELLCDARGKLWERAKVAGIECRELSIRNAIDFRAGIALRRLLAREHFDVVHFHTSRAHAMAPFVHGMAEVLVVTRRMDYLPNRFFAPLLYNRAVRAVAAISRGVADSLEQAGVDPARITIIPSGVDAERFHPAGESVRTLARREFALGNECAIGVVAALELRKGHRYVLEAMAELSRRSMPMRLLIAGNGSESDNLRAQARQLGIDGTTSFLGQIEDIRSLFAAIDIFALPSLKEGMGVALLEAMASGIAPIASRVGGTPDVIVHDESGILVEPGNSSALGAAILELVRDPERRRSIAAAARRRASSDFSMRAMAERTAALYRRCLAPGPAAKDKQCAA